MLVRVSEGSSYRQSTEHRSYQDTEFKIGVSLRRKNRLVRKLVLNVISELYKR